MYLHLELKTMSTERLTEAVARLHYLHSMMAASPGFVEAQICEYLGNPGQYLVIRTWLDEASHRGYRASDASKVFAASRPAHFIYDNLAVQEWDCLLDAPGKATGDYIVRELKTIDPNAWQAEVGAREEINAEALQAGGVESLRLYRMLANEKADNTQALILNRWSGRDAYVGYLEGRERPAADVVESYQVVDEIRA
jgi:heme-degrading monooxygenase HmoA